MSCAVSRAERACTYPKVVHEWFAAIRRSEHVPSLDGVSDEMGVQRTES